MSSVERLDLAKSSALPQFATGALAPADARVLSAVLLPVDADGATAVPGDVQGQTRHCITLLRELLESRGGSLADVLSLTVYVAEQMTVDVEVALTAIADEFAQHRPAVAAMGVRVLRGDEQVVEISALAAIKTVG